MNSEVLAPDLWLVTILVGLITYGLRLSFIVGLDRIGMASTLRRALRFVPVAVLTALVVSELLLRDGDWALSFRNTRLLAALVAVTVAWLSRNVLLTIAAGMLALLLLETVLS